MLGSYTPPDRNMVTGHVLKLSAEGMVNVFDINKSLLATGIKPGLAGDIWSSGGVSLLA